MVRLQLTEKRKDQILNLALVGSICLLLSGFVRTADHRSIDTPQSKGLQPQVLSTLSQPSLPVFKQLEPLTTSATKVGDGDTATSTPPPQQTVTASKKPTTPTPKNLTTILNETLSGVVDSTKLL